MSDLFPDAASEGAFAKKLMKPRRRRPPPEVSRLAGLLRDALIDAWVANNPTHDNPDFAAVRLLGAAGYCHVAAALLRRGVRLTELTAPACHNPGPLET